MGTNDDVIWVACVIGPEVRIYQDRDKESGVRFLRDIRQFPHYGAAKLFADEYEANQRNARKHRAD